MIRSKIFVAWALCSVLALSQSCSRMETDGSGLPDDTPIVLAPVMGGVRVTAEAKGTGFTSDSTMTSMGLFAGYTQEGSSSSPLMLNYIPNILYTKNAEGHFTTEVPRYWPVAGNLTFVAYSPYKPDFLMFIDPESEYHFQGFPSLVWESSTEIDKQEDICVGVSSNQPRQLLVPIEMHHATAQIYFAANNMELSEGEFIIIDTVILNSIIGRKKVKITDTPPYVEWEPDGKLSRSTNYELTRADGLLDSIPLPLSGDEGVGLEGRGYEISTKKGTMFLIPQSYYTDTKNIELIVKYTLWYADEEHGIAPQKMRHTVMESVLPACTWEPDKRYRYVLTINDKTREVGTNVIADYITKTASFFAMTCSFPSSAMIKSEGTIFNLTASVGPSAIIAKNKEVDWLSSNPDIASIEQLALEDESDDALKCRTARVTCKQRGTTIITATTRWAASEEEKCIATLELTVGPYGASFTPYGSEDKNSSWKK